MKYTICGFQQQELIRLGLDHTDALILRYIVDFYHNGGMYQRVDDNKVWFWFSYANVATGLPCIGIKSEKHVAAIMRKWITAGIIEKKIVKGVDEYLHDGKKKKRTGTWTYFHLIDTAMTALTTAEKKAPNKSEVPEIPQQGCGENGIPDAENPATKDSSPTGDSSFTDPSVTGAHRAGIIFAGEGWTYYSDETATFGDEATVYQWDHLPRSLPWPVMQWIDSQILSSHGDRRGKNHYTNE